MTSLAVVEIKGRQYLVRPNQTFEIDKVAGEKLVAEKVLLMVDNDKVELGNPDLDKKLEFEVVGAKKDKIRVFTYQPKANHHRTIGQKREKSLVKMVEKKFNR